MAKSKIAKIVFKKAKDGKLEWQGNKGIYYLVELTFADGTKGDSFAESETQFAVGQEHEYTYEPNANPSYNGKIKIVKPRGNFANGNFGGNNYQKANPKIAIAIAAVNMANELVAQRVIEIADAKKTAKYYFNMINELAGETAASPNPQNPQ